MHRDYQGSILAITNEVGDVLEYRSFDAWGAIVKVTDGAGNVLAKLTVLDRGYTGHEHLQGVGLIHMNGRLYDPALHRFLSPDNYVQDPYNTQNYNRYGYVLNNPLKYTDPSGEIAIAIIGVFILQKALIGGMIAVNSYSMNFAFNPGSILNSGTNDILKVFAIGALSGVATAGIGQVFGSAGNFGHEFSRAIAHAFSNGGISELSGGSFESGFISGGLSSLVGSGFQSSGKFAKTGVASVGFSALVGGIGAELSGGDFWKGASTGIVVSVLNHMGVHKMHSSVRVYDDDGEYVGKIKVLKYKNTGDGVEIELGFKAARNSKYTNYNWVQTVRTDHPLGGTSQTYTDPRPNDDNLPFYHTNSELAGMTNTSRGYNVEFYDSPNRNGVSNSWWKGELSLVGRFNGTYHQLHTFSYGFDMRNNHSFVAPLMTINPSRRQLNAF